MKNYSTIFLQVIIVLIGIGALALLLWEPHLEGRNAHATLFEIYFKDPFLMLVYIGSLPFFMALAQAFKVLGFVGQKKEFSTKSLKALRSIKYCAIAIIGFVVLEEIFIMLNHGSDDAAGGVFIGILIIFGSVIVAIAATVIEQVLQKAVDIKSENDSVV